jgi:hypothetical protein
MNEALKIFGSKREEVTRDWEKLHKELLNLYSLIMIIGMIKTRM